MNSYSDYGDEDVQGDDKHSEDASQNSAKKELAAYIERHSKRQEVRVSPRKASAQKRPRALSESGEEDDEMTYQPKNINFQTVPINEPSDDDQFSNSEYDMNEIDQSRDLVHSQPAARQDAEMDDCTSSEKNSISSSEKESLDRLLHRSKNNKRLIDDSADS